MHDCDVEGCDVRDGSSSPYVNITRHSGFYSIDMGFRDRAVVCSRHFPSILFTGFECIEYPVLRPTTWIHICDECWGHSA